MRLALCAKDAHERVNVQVGIGPQSLQFAGLQLQLAQPFGLCGVHATVLGSPLVEAGVTKAMFTASLLDRQAGFGLP